MNNKKIRFELKILLFYHKYFEMNKFEISLKQTKSENYSLS